ncbi:CVNH domain-containing protein [Xylariaceae sp. FL1019]|nr:CVNH domain-containing protein [Xylariaceae sp. FL1019]
MQFHATLVALIATCTGASSLPQPQKDLDDSFEKTCHGWELQGNAWFGAWCGNGKGLTRLSVINLNHCIANDFGTLVGRRDGDFAASCNKLSVQKDTTFSAHCDNADGWSDGNIKLSEVLSNRDGNLFCFGYNGCEELGC